jgi:phosphoserine phosphatase
MKYKLVVFDLDGTLIDVDSAWHMLHEFFGMDVHPERIEAKEKFMSGEIDYKEWADRDMDLMKKSGANREKIEKALRKIKLIKGSLETVKAVKKRGYRMALISDSLDIVIKTLIPDYKEMFDYIYINKLYFDKEGNILKVEITNFNFGNKAEGLKRICKEEGILPKETIFIGDHNNDIQIAKAAGFSIAFNSKSEELNEISDVVIQKKDLREILKYIN